MGIRAAVSHLWDVIEGLTPTTAPGTPFQCVERAGEGAGVDLEEIRNRSRQFRLYPGLQVDGGEAMYTGAGRLRAPLYLEVLYDGAVPVTERRVMQSEDLHSLMVAMGNPSNYLAGTTDTIHPLTDSPDVEPIEGDGGTLVAELMSVEFVHIYRES